MPVTIAVESYEEFAERHGGRPILVANDFLFADGARVNRENTRLRAEPPPDDFARLRFRRRYYLAHLQAEERAFASFQNRCHERAYLSSQFVNLPGVPDNAAEQLERGKKRIESLRAELEAVEAAILNTPEMAGHRQLQLVEQQRQANLSAAIAKISAIQI
jgi:hypothetical protein